MKITSRFIVAASIALTVLSLVGWGDAKESANAQEDTSLQTSNPVVNAELVAADNRFSFKLFSEILKQQPNENIFVSPSSVAIALAMTYNGTGGETRQVMAQTLELEGMSLEEINEGNAALNTSLENADPHVQLSIANSLWTAESKPVKPEFLQNIQNFYEAKVQNLNFGNPAAPSIINAWIQESTNNKIDKIVDPGDITSGTVFVLINAIHFLGTWSDPFPKEATVERPFTLLDGTQKQHPMMFQESYYSVRGYQNDLFQAIELPYGDRRLSMYVFLPNLGVSLNTVSENLNLENWENWMNEFQYDEAPLLIGLPRFSLEYDIDLKNVLKALGMEVVFGEDADFSAMTPRTISMSEVKHKTFVEVNEEGTEASGVTSIGGTRGSHTEIIINRPFFCMIRDNQTGAILFMGMIVEPN
ncbi:serpin family protein [Coleofasciculus sp. LEGE 07092]|nr:serpin family protein [Coleofasciculus sp. LEGE 07081]MBE9150929.1 serpin family protein [Coleofasciculus sp. LEGE 07092]